MMYQTKILLTTLVLLVLVIGTLSLGAQMNKNIAFATSNATSNTTAIAVSGAKQHTADYLYGYPIGKRDGRIGIFDVGDSCDHTPNGNMKRCVAGYTDEYKSVCGNTNNRPTPSCK